VKVRVNKAVFQVLTSPPLNPLPPPQEYGIFDRGGEMGLFTRPSSNAFSKS